MKKGCCLGCLGFLVMFAGIFFLVMNLTKPVVTCAETFLVQVSENHLAEAYKSSTKGLQQSLSEADLQARCKAYGLDQYRPGSASWNSRGFRNNNGWVSGSFKTKDDKSMPLRVEMYYEDGAWKVSDLSTNNSSE